MRLRWTAIAAADLEEIHEYVGSHFRDLAQPTVRAIYEEASLLRKFPLCGRPGAIPNTRELFMDRLPYVIVYRVQHEAVELLRILHTKRDRSLLQ